MYASTAGGTSPSIATSAKRPDSPPLRSRPYVYLARLRTSVDDALDSASVKPSGSVIHLKRGPNALKSAGASHPVLGATRKSNSVMSRSPVRPSRDSHVRSCPGGGRAAGRG